MDIKPGDEFGRLTAERWVTGSRATPGGWFCACKCGNTLVVQSNYLRAGRVVSCGCYKAEGISRRNATHGLSRSPEYSVWCNIVQRCTNPHASHHDRYGGRGIVISPEWRESFEQFLADMGPRPSSKHTIERRDNDGPYSKNNCYWKAGGSQNNTRRTRWIEARGKRQSLQDWSRESGVSPVTILARIKLGWPPERAVTEPAKARRDPSTLKPLAKEKAARLMMIRRCRDVANKDYGGRGIEVHPAWVVSFEAFFADVGPAPSAKHSLDRKENDKGYMPGNVVWATKVSQARNRRNNRLLTHQGVTRTVAEWAEVTGITVSALNQRLNVYKWPVERALTEPVRGS